MSININNKNYDVYVGSKRMGSVYVGSKLVYQDQYNVYFTKGSNVWEIYTSTNSAALSGNISGTKYNNNTVVYCFVVFDSKNYKPQSSWIYIGQKQVEIAGYMVLYDVYRTGSATITNANIDFGTIGVELRYSQPTISVNTSGGNVRYRFYNPNDVTMDLYTGYDGSVSKTGTLAARTYTSYKYRSFEGEVVSCQLKTTDGSWSSSIVSRKL